MYWTTELADMLADAPWPSTKDELIEYVNRTSGCAELIENLRELEDDGEEYDCIQEIWIDYPQKNEYDPAYAFDNEGDLNSDNY